MAGEDPGTPPATAASLNQGETGDVVGFAWTHWLADRGVVVPRAELGAEYATELQREAQALGGRRPESSKSLIAC
jgi:hypothetical protein